MTAVRAEEMRDGMPIGGDDAELAVRDAGPPAALQHGGDLAAARARFPDAPAPWVDLSTGINPRAFPLPEFPAEAWTRLPGRAELDGLLAAAAAAYGAPGPDHVVAAPGTQALIALLPRLVPSARRVAVLGFGYEEHPESWRRAGAEVAIVDDIAALGHADVAVVVNPNNPDGRLVPVDRLAAVAAEIGRRAGLLVVDEAFADMAPTGMSLVPHLEGTGAVVLRSFGKAYGLAGLRLGFACAAPALAARIAAMLGPWAVSGPALAIGTAALGDRAWLAGTIAAATADAARLDGLLAGAGFEVVGGTPLFRLARHAEAGRWFERLGRAGILARPFARRPEWLRFGLPADAAAWSRLAAALSG